VKPTPPAGEAESSSDSDDYLLDDSDEEEEKGEKEGKEGKEGCKQQ